MLDRTEQCIQDNETDTNDLQAQSVVLGPEPLVFEQDRIEWESLATAFTEVLRAIENHFKNKQKKAVNLHQFLDVNVKFSEREILGDHSSLYQFFL